ncbi:hypothetical protein V5F53_16735 [Xanthobacter sp. V4C-4]|uniref:hypothetical protein n=1 Tax=Xanthobacter cornucopiae TaxID=3119924 RepID=UPI003729FBE9
MTYNHTEVAAKADKMGLLPWANHRPTGSTIWESWADRVLNIAANARHWSPEERAAAERDCNAYSGHRVEAPAPVRQRSEWIARAARDAAEAMPTA